jgi:hypothetical protein
MVPVTKKAGGITYNEYNEIYRLPEQEFAEQLLLTEKHAVLAFEPGKGKSYPIIHAIREVEKLKGRPIKVLIMSAAVAIKAMWKADIMPQGVLPKQTYFVTSGTAIGKVKEALVATKWDIIVIDECQSLRSGVTRKKSKFAKVVYSLTAKAEYVWGMTGTISGNNNIEPWAVLHNLNVGGMGRIRTAEFKKIFCNMELQRTPYGSFMKPVSLNERGEKLLMDVYLKSVMFWPYDDDDDMPAMDVTPMALTTFKVESTKEYENALQGILKLGGHESTTMKAIAMQKAQQALNGFLYYYDDDMVRQTYIIPNFVNPKLPFIVNECKREKTIVGYRFQIDGDNIQTALTKANLTWTNDILKFKTGNYNALVLQCARGNSVNLQLCQNIVYYSIDHSFIYYKQFIHRTWRRGQDKPCKLSVLVNTTGDKYIVEGKIWKALVGKQNIHDALMSIKHA